MPRQSFFVQIENWIDRPNNQEWKESGSTLVLFGQPKDANDMPDMDIFKAHADFLYREVQAGHVRSMKAVGHAMSPDLRETGRGGLAGTPTGPRIRDRIGHPAGEA